MKFKQLLAVMKISILQLIFILHFNLIDCSTTNDGRICEDFYQYACADWLKSRIKPDSEPFWNVYTETAQWISQTLQSILENDDFTNVGDEKSLYAACVRDGDYIKELRFLVGKLGGVQLSSRNKNHRYDYLMHVIEVTKLLNIHPILKFYVKENVLYIERGDLIYPEIFLTHPNGYNSELNVYVTWIEKSLSLLNPREDKTRSNFIESLMRGRKHSKASAIAAKEIVAFEVELAKLKRGKLVKISAGKLNKALAFKFLFGSEDFDDFSEEILIDEVYFNGLLQLLEKTSWRHVSNYIVWTAIKDLSRNINADFRKLSFEVDQALIGVSSDISREKECIDQVINYIGHGNLQENFAKMTKQNHKLMVQEVTNIANEIRQVFLSIIENNKEFSKTTRMNIMKKISGVKLAILSPQNEQIPITTTQSRQFTLGTNHFMNLLRLKSQKFQRNIRKTSKINETNVTTTNIQWPASIFDVNAFYSPSQNAIILPLGILQPPFYDPNQHFALNYGALGALIGHEFSHILDNLHRNELTTANDFEQFQSRGVCGKSNVDTATLNENIADFTGIRLSYFAMEKKMANDIRAENDSEFFFLNYAKMWCELSGESKEILMQDEHAPVALRVKTTLEHFSAFYQTFSCLHKEVGANECDFW